VTPNQFTGDKTFYSENTLFFGRERISHDVKTDHTTPKVDLKFTKTRTATYRFYRFALSWLSSSWVFFSSLAV